MQHDNTSTGLNYIFLSDGMAVVTAPALKEIMSFYGVEESLQSEICEAVFLKKNDASASTIPDTTGTSASGVAAPHGMPPNRQMERPQGLPPRPTKVPGARARARMTRKVSSIQSLLQETPEHFQTLILKPEWRNSPE